MTTIALIQNQFGVLNALDVTTLTGMQTQIFKKFFEVLVEESGYELERATNLANYRLQYPDGKPDVVIAAPFPTEGNPAGAFAELLEIRRTFSDAFLIIWSGRSENAIRETVGRDYPGAIYYTGSVLDCAEDFADLIFEHSRKKK